MGLVFPARLIPIFSCDVASHERSRTCFGHEPARQKKNSPADPLHWLRIAMP